MAPGVEQLESADRHELQRLVKRQASDHQELIKVVRELQARNQVLEKNHNEIAALARQMNGVTQTLHRQQADLNRAHGKAAARSKAR